MTTLKMPKYVATHIDSMFRKFWWGKDQNSTKGFAPKSWKSICIPKSLLALVSKIAISSIKPST